MRVCAGLCRSTWVHVGLELQRSPLSEPTRELRELTFFCRMHAIPSLERELEQVTKRGLLSCFEFHNICRVGYVEYMLQNCQHK